MQILQPSGSKHVKILLITSPSARLMGLHGGYLLDAISRIMVSPACVFKDCLLQLYNRQKSIASYTFFAVQLAIHVSCMN